MGKRGPAPTPTPLLQLRGSWRAGSNPNEPQPPEGSPRCPDFLCAEAIAVWDQMVPALAQMGVLSEIDGAALARYCDAMVRWTASAKFLEKNGEVYTLKDADGKIKMVMPFPQVAQYHRLAAMLLRLEQEFGLTPSSRSRVQVPDKKPRDASPKMRLFAS